MLKLSEWPVSRVLFLSGLWILLNLALFAWQVHRQAVWVKDQTEKGGVWAVTADVRFLFFLMLVPPLILLLAWYMARGVARL